MRDVSDKAERKSREEARERESTPLNTEKRNWSSYKGLTVDTLAHRGDEGRGYLR